MRILSLSLSSRRTQTKVSIAPIRTSHISRPLQWQWSAIPPPLKWIIIINNLTSIWVSSSFAFSLYRSCTYVMKIYFKVRIRRREWSENLIIEWVFRQRCEEEDWKSVRWIFFSIFTVNWWFFERIREGWGDVISLLSSPFFPPPDTWAGAGGIINAKAQRKEEKALKRNESEESSSETVGNSARGNDKFPTPTWIFP